MNQSPPYPQAPWTSFPVGTLPDKVLVGLTRLRAADAPSCRLALPSFRAPRSASARLVLRQAARRTGECGARPAAASGARGWAPSDARPGTQATRGPQQFRARPRRSDPSGARPPAVAPAAARPGESRTPPPNGARRAEQGGRGSRGAHPSLEPLRQDPLLMYKLTVCLTGTLAGRLAFFVEATFAD